MKIKEKRFEYSFQYPDSRPRVENVGINNKTAYIVIQYHNKEFTGRIGKTLAKQLMREK